ncbi:MAG: hypothetical protein H7A24_17080 [Leptospiraceae bacterium]|nr:hypothetical protein [Leptospiraceae bacterium]
MEAIFLIEGFFCITADAGSSSVQLSILMLCRHTRFLSLETFGQKTRVGEQIRHL